MRGQAAVRWEEWKLVLRGQLVEGAIPEDDVHLSNLEADMGERNNLKDEQPQITTELKTAAETWRSNIEKHWKNYWLPKANGTTSY